MIQDDMREKLAELCHEQWSGWMRYLFSKCAPGDGLDMILPDWAVIRWGRQCTTPYSKLTEEEKDSDRKEADRFISLIADHQKKMEINP